jgi:hypothetical protein
VSRFPRLRFNLRTLVWRMWRDRRRVIQKPADTPRTPSKLSRRDSLPPVVGSVEVDVDQTSGSKLRLLALLTIVVIMVGVLVFVLARVSKTKPSRNVQDRKAKAP